MSRVWGVSRRRDLIVCPAMYVAKYETKEWVEVPSPSMERGSAMHKILEEAIKYAVVLPKELQHVDDYVMALLDEKAKGAMVEAELKIGLDTNGNPVEFFRGPNLRARLALDVAANIRNNALAIDWKTGRYKPEHRDDALFYGAALCMAVKPDSCVAQYIYLDNMGDSFSIDIENPDDIIDDYLNKFDAADEYLDSEGKSGQIRLLDPPTNMGTHCNWCGNVSCGHNKNEKAQAIHAANQRNAKLLFKS